MNKVTGNQVIGVLQKLAKELQTRQLSPTEWTSEIKSVLVRELSQPDEQIGAYAHSVKAGTRTDWGEWLWDFVLAKHKSHPELEKLKINMVDRLMVIAEIERNTNYNEIAVDFQKLVFGVADLKVYIFPKNNEANNEKIHEFCLDLSKTTGTREGDPYLLIGFPMSAHTSELFVRAWQVRAGEIVNQPELAAG